MPPRRRKSTSRGTVRATADNDPPAKRRLGRPPGKASAETRAAILAAAQQQFVLVGYERATNRAVAQDAGVTAGAIYQYFDSKAALYVAVVAETMETLMPRLRSAASGAPSARAALAAMVREQLAEQQVAPSRFLAGVPLEMQRHPELAAALVAEPGSFFELVVDVVRRGVREGQIERSKAEGVIGLYIAAMIGLSVHGGTVPASHSKAAIAGFIELLEGTLFG